MCEIADVVHHDGDTSQAARAPTSRRWPFIEMHIPGLHDLEKLQAREPPRQIKTHVTANFFAKQVGTLLISAPFAKLLHCFLTNDRTEIFHIFRDLKCPLL